MANRSCSQQGPQKGSSALGVRPVIHTNLCPLLCLLHESELRSENDNQSLLMISVLVGPKKRSSVETEKMDVIVSTCIHWPLSATSCSFSSARGAKPVRDTDGLTPGLAVPTAGHTSTTDQLGVQGVRRFSRQG